MNDDLCDMHPLEAQGERSDGEAGVCPMHLWQALHLSFPVTQLPKAPASDTRDSRSEASVAQQTETVIVLTIKGEIPESLRYVLEQKAYDYCNAKGKPVEVDAKVWYALTIKEQA
jgi:hypothetical protein